MAGTLTVLGSGRTDAHDDQRRRADVAWSVLLRRRRWGSPITAGPRRRSANSPYLNSLHWR